MQTLMLKQLLILVSEHEIHLNNDHFNLFLQICPKNYSNQINVYPFNCGKINTCPNIRKIV